MRTITEPTKPSAAQEVVHRDLEAIGQPLDGANLEIALAPLQGTDVGPVHAKKFGERFLTKPFGHAVSPQVAAETGQRFAFHGGQDDRWPRPVLPTPAQQWGTSAMLKAPSPRSAPPGGTTAGER